MSHFACFWEEVEYRRNDRTFFSWMSAYFYRYNTRYPTHYPIGSLKPPSKTHLMQTHSPQDSLLLWYGLDPPDLTKICDGCNATFTIFHAIDRTELGLVTARHNELHGVVADLSIKSFTPTHMRDNPLICAGCAVQSPKAHPEGSKPSPLS